MRAIGTQRTDTTWAQQQAKYSFYFRLKSKVLQERKSQVIRRVDASTHRRLGASKWCRHVQKSTHRHVDAPTCQHVDVAGRRRVNAPDHKQNTYVFIDPRYLIHGIFFCSLMIAICAFRIMEYATNLLRFVAASCQT